MQTLVIIGAGGHGKVVLDAALASGRKSPILLVDSAPRFSELRGCPVRSENEVDMATIKPFQFVCAIGDNPARASVYRRCLDAGGEPVSIFHPSAVVSEDAAVGPGTVVFANSVINPGAVIGANCIVNTGASVDHDCRISDHAHLCPGVRLAGTVTVGSLTMVGIGSSVIQRVTIGARCVLGAGSVVVRDIPDDSRAYGVPARVI